MLDMPDPSRRSLLARLMPRCGRKRWLMAFTGGLALMGGLALAQGKPSPEGLAVAPIAVTATPIAAFDKTDASRTRFGALEFMGGLELSSPSPHFGGWSGLSMAPDGGTLLAVSDAGTWMTAEPVYRQGRLTGLGGARLGPLKARDGRTLTRGRDRDAEAVVIAKGTLGKGEAFIAFEQNDRIGRFRIEGGELAAPDTYIAMPEAARAMRMDGFEALAVLPGGTLLGIAELALKGEARHAAWIWNGGKPHGFRIETSPGFDVTDAAALADGSVILLERRFRWAEGMSMKLRRVAAGAIRPGAAVASEILLEADLGQEIDNMEGLAARREADGTTRLTLISDNNFNGLFQRTVLLEFALRPEPTLTRAR